MKLHGKVSEYCFNFVQENVCFIAIMKDSMWIAGCCDSCAYWPSL
jgi:hypothetical protein